VVWCGEWAGQPSGTSSNCNPSGWRTGGKSAGLAKGMPNLSSTGLEGGRSWSRAERSAEDLGLDNEMLRAEDSSLIASEEPPGLEGRRARLSYLQASSFSGPAGLGTERCAAAARKTSVIRRDASNHEPNGLDPVYPLKTALRFPPRLCLGGFLSMGHACPAIPWIESIV
jgi:hypothetical protein